MKRTPSRYRCTLCGRAIPLAWWERVFARVLEPPPLCWPDDAEACWRRLEATS